MHKTNALADLVDLAGPVRGPHVGTFRPHALRVKMTGRSNKLPQIMGGKYWRQQGMGVVGVLNSKYTLPQHSCKQVQGSLGAAVASCLAAAAAVWQ